MIELTTAKYEGRGQTKHGMGRLSGSELPEADKLGGMDQGSDLICDLIPWSGAHPLLAGYPPTLLLVASFWGSPGPPVALAAAANVNPRTRLSHVTEIPPAPANDGV